MIWLIAVATMIVVLTVLLATLILVAGIGQVKERVDSILKGQKTMGQALTDLQTAMSDFIAGQADFDALVEEALTKITPAPGADTISATDAENVVAQIRQAAATQKAERDKVAAALAALNAPAEQTVDTGGAAPA
jgi:hypothetical protein